MDKIIKELSGHSGSKIYLMEDELGLFVRKVGNTIRNEERLNVLLKNGYNVPQIYHFSKENDILNMEYIHGLDMKNYLMHNNEIHLIDGILDILKSFSLKTIEKDYTSTYYQKLSWFTSVDGILFNKDQLIERLPKVLPSSIYHGDLTLENLINKNNSFYMIDGMTTEYDSYVFDIAKMRQDLNCKWFIRHSNIKIDTKLKNIEDKILQEFPIANDDNLLILMLLRVFAYTKQNDGNYEFLIREMNRLWK